ncbi:MAG: bifunctional 5,10-methylenetetrahydrofolate dehydrogenase/5,10-methenyltetrahydrofolate cyclohydrolase, partial [Bacillota bacterium]|nr:bifunctional 5,10-methylenetetrahydrofolate dehydrogenase/5,10-methenyltetrahydrofolate cyclohydrolase [Bacillota bacterium]
AGQVIIDVGINRVNGRLVGDVDWPAIHPIVAAATPVPGGVGAITTSILLKHTVQSAWLQQPSAQPLIIE